MCVCVCELWSVPKRLLWICRLHIVVCSILLNRNQWCSFEQSVPCDAVVQLWKNFVKRKPLLNWIGSLMMNKIIIMWNNAYDVSTMIETILICYRPPPPWQNRFSLFNLKTENKNQKQLQVIWIKCVVERWDKLQPSWNWKQ